MKRPPSHYMSDKSHKRLARTVSESGDALPQLALADVLESSLLQGDYPAHVEEPPSAAEPGYMPQDDVFGTVELEETGSLNDVSQGLLETAGSYGASPGLQQFSEVSSYTRPVQSPTVNQSNQEAIGPPAPPPPAPGSRSCRGIPRRARWPPGSIRHRRASRRRSGRRGSRSRHPGRRTI